MPLSVEARHVPCLLFALVGAALFVGSCTSSTGSGSLEQLDGGGAPSGLPRVGDISGGEDGGETGSDGAVCVPVCDDKECGDDGCGGVCGACPEIAPYCVDGQCAFTCTADCTDKTCGDDGCGGSCGDCPEGYDCESNTCVCLPNCGDSECGPNGCGGTCGDCDPSTPYCNDGTCSGVCEPACDGKECGDDGCGDSCGVCPDVAPYCVEHLCAIECTPQCDGKVCGDDGCFGSCGTCASNEICESGLCNCVPACQGKECGDDGCGGSCGGCLKDNQSCSGGSCLDHVCTPGSVSCDGNAVATCKSDGQDWAFTPCDGNEACEGGACIPKICNPNATSCAGAQVMLCNDQGTVQSVLETCAQDQTCQDGVCLDHVCTPNTSTCNVANDAVLTCQASGLAEVPTACPGGAICDAGACLPVVCTAVALFCDDISVHQCNDNGTDATLVQECENATQVCSEGVCLNKICQPGVSTCSPFGELITCNEDYLSYNTTDCPGGAICEAGACVPVVCSPGALICEGDDVHQCNDNGTGATLVQECEDAAQVCSAGVCLNKSCSSLLFGDFDRVVVPNSNLSLGLNFTFAAWVNPTDLGAQGTGVIFTNGISNVYCGAYTFKIQADGRIALRTRAGGGFKQCGSQYDASSSSTISMDAWTHVAVAHDSSGVRFYLNGALDNTGAASNSPPYAPVADLWIGKESGPHVGWSGWLDDVQIWGRALSSNEVAQTMVNGVDVSDTSDRIAFWDFDEAEGTTAQDSSGNGHHGTIVDTSWSEDCPP